MNKQQWEERRAVIGASDVPAIMGLSKYKGPLTVYREKAGEIGPTWSPAAVRGQILEAVIDDYVGEQFGDTEYQPQITHEVSVGKGSARMTAPLRVTPDYLIDGMPADAKTATSWLEREWDSYLETGEIKPGSSVERYVVQLHAQMLATGKSEGRLFVLFGDFSALEDDIAEYFGGREYVEPEDLNVARFDVWRGWYTEAIYLGTMTIREIVIERDEMLIDAIQEACVGFWQCVTTSTPPDATPADLGSNADLIQSGDTLVEGLDALCERHDRAKSEHDRWKAAKSEIEDEIKTLLLNEGCDAARGDTRSVKWAETTRTTLDAKAIKATSPDVYEAFSRTSVSRRLVIK